MKRIFNILSSVVLLSAIAACEAELPPIVIYPDPIFDKYGTYTVNTISIYDQDETVITVSRIHGLSKDVVMTVGVDEALLAEYNKLNGTSYELMPEEYYDIPATVRLERTVKEIEVPVVMYPKNMVAAEGLTKANNYVIPISITDASTTLDDMGAAAEVVLVPNVVDPKFEVTVPEVNSSLDFVRGNRVNQSLLLNAVSNFTTIDPSKVTYVPVPEAVATFNQANGTAYELLPAEYYQVKDGVLDEESMNYAIEVEFTCHQIEAENDSYILPLKMQSDVYEVKQNNILYVLVELTQLRISVADGGSLVTRYSRTGEISLTLNAPLAKDYDINLKYDASKVAEYNEAHGTSFIAADPSSLNITAGIIPAGKYSAKVQYEIEWADHPYDSGVNMLLPLTIDEDVLMEGTIVDQNKTVYVELVKTVAGTWNVEPITPIQPAAVQSYWTALVGSSIWLADKAITPDHKYAVVYGGKWTDGILFFNIDFDNPIEGKPGCYPIVDLRDRAAGNDKIIATNNYFDSVNEEVYFEFIIHAVSAPGINKDKPLEDSSHVPGYIKYGKLSGRQ